MAEVVGTDKDGVPTVAPTVDGTAFAAGVTLGQPLQSVVGGVVTVNGATGYSVSQVSTFIQLQDPWSPNSGLMVDVRNGSFLGSRAPLGTPLEEKLPYVLADSIRAVVAEMDLFKQQTDARLLNIENSLAQVVGQLQIATTFDMSNVKALVGELEGFKESVKAEVHRIDGQVRMASDRLGELEEMLSSCVLDALDDSKDLDDVIP